ncbi:hypothetical protein BDQ12DRAFT_431039 [Crucibulum laeve]|uniref:F-box domain-containing protein n=1 Tax=Crucibulum laeve TaxID=68775 RepID=A0A5C3M9U2_9AGAR|nr:hypothetical protein BDQ12DRAFT_431039 [Crucibulum laeve]
MTSLTSNIASSSFIPRMLPDDVILEIVKAGLQYDYLASTPIPFQITMSALCQHWRRVIINSPTLWQNIDVVSYTDYNLDLFFERSNPALINVSFDAMTLPRFRFQQQNYPRVLKMLKSNSDRLRTLVIRVGSSMEIHLFTEPLRGCELPNLQNLTLHCLTPECNITTHTRLLPQANGIRYLRKMGICSKCAPPLVDLTCLDIHLYQPSIAEFRNLLHDCPALATLILRNFGPSQDNSEDLACPALIEAPSLRSLGLHFDGFHSECNCTCPLSLLVAENLEYLETDQSSVAYLQAHLGACIESWQKHPQRRRFRFERLSMRDELLSFIESLPQPKVFEFWDVEELFDEILSVQRVVSIRNAEVIVYDISSEHMIGSSWLVDGLSSGAVIINSPFTLLVDEQDPNCDTYRALFSTPRAFPCTMEFGSIRREGLLRGEDLEDPFDDTESDGSAYDDYDMSDSEYHDMEYGHDFEDDYPDFGGYDDYGDFEDDDGLEGILVAV